MRIPTLRAQALAAAVGGRVIVSGVDLTIAPGSRVACVGTNGAGKSTLLRAMAGITEPAAGKVMLDDTDLSTMPRRERARTIAFVGQEDTPPAELRLGELVELGRIPRRLPWQVGNAQDRTVVRRCLDEVGLSDRIDDGCDRLSGGERRRAMLARGLAQEAPVLVLDEPTNHLDIAWQMRLLAMLGKHPGTVLAAVHDLDLVLRYFDTVLVLHDGAVRRTGPPHATLTPDLLREVFAVSTRQIRHPDRDQLHLLIDELEGPST